MSKRIGALTISQSPRYDLIQPLRLAFPDAEIIESGALDFTDVTQLPDGSDAYYPLTTTLNNGDKVTLDQDFLAPLLQTALDDLQQKNVDATILLCAGDFPDLKGDNLVKPTETAHNILRSMNILDVLIVSPIAFQNKPIRDKWNEASFNPTVITMPDNSEFLKFIEELNIQTKSAHDCVVLDYVGFPWAGIRRMQNRMNKPLFELGQLAIATLKSVIG